MGNALVFQNIFKEIQADEVNQYYSDIALQYGRLVRNIFDFSPVLLSTLNIPTKDS